MEEVKTSGEVSILHKQVDTCSPINFEVDEIPEMPETGEILFTTLPGASCYSDINNLILQSSLADRIRNLW